MNIENDNIFWSPKFTLRLEDFRGEPDEKKLFHANTRVNLEYFFNYNDRKTSSRFKIRINKIIVKCSVDLTKSWIKKEVITNPHFPSLSKHEQGHFDLGEEYARSAEIKMNNKFSGKSFSCESTIVENAVNEIKEMLDKEFKFYVYEYKKANDGYDEETNYSRNSSKQIEYNQRFEKLHNEQM